MISRDFAGNGYETVLHHYVSGYSKGIEIVNSKIGMGFFAVLATLVLSGCGGGGNDGSNVVVYDVTTTISPATIDPDTSATVSQYVSYDLDPGTYTAEVTSSYGGGLNIQWVPGSGAGCGAVTGVQAYTGTCSLGTKGQLVLWNVFLLTEQTVTLKVTRN